jgi:2',3'-cyclic-nucleotide 2'-phosphodiesterase (5'-nucleotidase family)
LGGLARRAHMVESIRSNEGEVLLLDCGGFFAKPGQTLMKLRTELTLETMNHIGYDALNLGYLELSLGLRFLKDMNSALSIPFLSSNLVHETGDLTWLKDHIMKVAGGLRVAILGVMPSYALEKVRNPEYVRALRIIPPEIALDELVPEVREEADFVILLSQCGFEATASLLTKVQGIDLAISCGRAESTQGHEAFPAPVLQSGSRGDYLGSIRLTKSEAGTISIGKPSPIELNESIPSHKGIAAIMRDAFSKKYLERKELLAQKRRQEMRKQLLEGLKVTPEEFLEREQERKIRIIKRGTQ